MSVVSGRKCCTLIFVLCAWFSVLSSACFAIGREPEATEQSTKYQAQSTKYKDQSTKKQYKSLTTAPVINASRSCILPAPPPATEHLGSARSDSLRRSVHRHRRTLPHLPGRVHPLWYGPT